MPRIGVPASAATTVALGSAAAPTSDEAGQSRVARIVSTSGIWNRRRSIPSAPSIGKPTKRAKQSLAGRARAERASVEPQIVGHVLDPIIGFMWPRVQMPRQLKPTRHDGVAQNGDVGQPHVIAPSVEPNVDSLDAGAM